jgi:hypothetical protein
MTAMRAHLVRFSLLAAAIFAAASVTAGDVTPPIQIKLVSAADQPHPQGPRYQIDPTADLRKTFPQASQISVGVAVVPDPLVPRYRRLYDLSVEAIELGMLNAGYVLDRYSLPWDEKLKAESPEKDEADNANPASAPAAGEKSDDALPYGLLVFRCDTWRRGKCNGSRGTGPRSHVRALYVVTDTATYGLDDRGLRKAAKRIRDQLKDQTRDPPSANQPARPQVSLLAFPTCPESGGATLVVLGPNFSGALDSVGEQSGAVAQGSINGICLVSGSATNPTNQLVHDSYPQVQYVPLALNDWSKLAHVAGLAQQLLGLKDSGSGRFRDVTILAEASTFGFGVCEQPTDPTDDYLRSDPGRKMAEQLCQDARVLYFPASIADLRDEVQQQQDAARRDAHNPLHIAVPDDQLPLLMRAENGSEYPESRQSESTTASKQLALEQLLDSLSAHKPPQLVVIVATDVRDRLFLFDKLRERLPRAMFVDLDADNLVAHHTYLHATRGALAIGSAKLLMNGRQEHAARDASSKLPPPDTGDIYGCHPSDAKADRNASMQRQPFSSWSSDFQAILADSVQRLYEPGSAGAAAPCFLDPAGSKELRRATVQVVTLEGLKQISNAFGSDFQPLSRLLQTLLEMAEALAPFFCMAVGWIWIAALLPPRRAAQVVRHPLWRQAGTIGTVETAAIGCIFFAAVSLAFTFSFRSADHDNPLFFWLAAAVVIGAWRLVACWRLLRQTRGGATRFDSQQAFAPAALALGAALLAATPWWWQHVAAPAGSKDFVDHNALIDLALDPDTGLAFFLVIAIGASALLYASLTLETGAVIVHRNLNLLKASRRASQVLADSRLAPEEFKSELLGPLPIQIGAAVLIVALTLPDLLGITGGVRLTVFGSFASCVALVALMATTMAAAMLTFAALRAGRRVIALSGRMRNSYLTSRNLDVSDPSSEIPGFWPPGSSTPRTFPTTPVTVHVSHVPPATVALLEPNQIVYWNRLLTAWLHKGCDDSEQRAAVFLLFATEIGVHRWLVAGAVMCALASVGIVYLFPIESDMLLLLNLGLLITAGAIAGYTATTFEGDALLSNVLCNRPRKAKMSITLFVFIAAPFLALSGAIAVTRIPGVVDWSGGVIGLLLGLGLHP